MNDGELLTQSRQFNLIALAEVYDRFSPELYRYAYRLLGDTSWAEDCVAETFSRLLLTFQDGKGPKDNLRAYLFRIAHNWITDQFRRRNDLQTSLDETFIPTSDDLTEMEAGRAIELEKVRTALKKLTPEQRQVIVLKFVEGWDTNEIAAAVGKPIGAVKSLQHRAIEALRRQLIGETSELEQKYFDNQEEITQGFLKGFIKRKGIGI